DYSFFFFFSSRRRHTRSKRDWSSDVCSSDLISAVADHLDVYFQGQWGDVGGTSAAAPIWATGQALVNEDTMQHLNTFGYAPQLRSEEHTSELQSRLDIVCRLLLEKKKIANLY